MDIKALNAKYIELSLSRVKKSTKFAETSDPKVRDRLEKEISELDQEIKLYEDAINERQRSNHEHIAERSAKTTATLERFQEQMKNANPIRSQNAREYFKQVPQRPMTISGGGGCLGAFCSTNNATKNVINVSKMNVNQIVEKIKELLLKAFTIETPQEQSKKLMTEVSVYMNELVKQSKSTVPATRDAAMVAIINVKETVDKVRKNSIAQAADRHREINADQRRRYAEVQEMNHRAGIA
jgi:hypothetical protein